jgi:hypothetical protein
MDTWEYKKFGLYRSLGVWNINNMEVYNLGILDYKKYKIEFFSKFEVKEV